MTYSEELKMMKTAAAYTVAALIVGVIGAHYVPGAAGWAYTPAILVGCLSIPLAAYVDFLHS